MIYSEDIRILSAYYCYLTDKNTVLQIKNPECEEDGNGYVVAEYKRDKWNDIECMSCTYNVDCWEDIYQAYNVTKFLGCGYYDADAVMLLDKELENKATELMVA